MKIRSEQSRRFEPLYLIVALFVAIGLATIAFGIINPVYFGIPIILLVIVFAISNPIYALAIFVFLMPFENVFPADILTLSKGVGVILVISWILRLMLKEKKVRIDSLIGIMLIFLAWGMISFVWTIDAGVSQIRLFTYIQLIIFYLILINTIKDEKQLELILLANYWGGMVLIASGMLELIVDIVGGASHLRLAGLTGNANMYVVWCLSTLPGFYTAFQKNLALRLSSIAGLVGMVITIAYAQSRGGLVSMLLILLVLLFFKETRKTMILLLPLAVMGFILVVPSEYWLRFSSIGFDYIDRTRDLWPLGFRIFTDHFWLGTGLGTNYVALRHYDPFLAIHGIESVHSAPLAIGMELGILGLLLYLSFLLVPIINFMKQYIGFTKKVLLPERAVIRAIIILSVLFGFLASWVKGGGLETSKVLWLLLGLLMASTTIPTNFVKDSK